jgi:hypothetical protein
MEFNIQRQGRKWGRAEVEQEYRKLCPEKIELIEGRMFWTDEDRLRLKTPGPCLELAVAGLVDDVFVGQVTQPETLRGLCDGIEVVFSSIGITRQTGRVSYLEVDYR